MIIPKEEKLHKKQVRERLYRQNPTRLVKEKEYQAKHKLTLKHRATALKNKARIRAEKKNLPFELSFEFVLDKLTNGICEATGLPLEMSIGARKQYTPSLDRINPKEGYTFKNTQMVCTVYNLMKSNFSEKETLEFIKKLKDIQWQ